MQPGAKGLNEVVFYDKLFFCTGELHDDIQKLKDLVPRFIGCERIRDKAGHLRILLPLYLRVLLVLTSNMKVKYLDASTNIVVWGGNGRWW